MFRRFLVCPAATEGRARRHPRVLELKAARGSCRCHGAERDSSQGHVRTKQPLEVQDSSKSEYVLPGAPRVVGEIVVVPPARLPLSELRRGGEVARALGDCFLPHAECLQQFLAEVRTRLVALDSALAEDS